MWGRSITLCQDIHDTLWQVNLCACECYYGFMLNSSVFFLLPIMQPSEKSPIKSTANCAIIHSPYPAGYQIHSGVIDQNKTETQTNTHTQHCPTDPLCCLSVSAVWGMWQRSRSEPTGLTADPAPSWEATVKDRGQTRPAGLWPGLTTAWVI